jgi:hypothetical protein
MVKVIVKKSSVCVLFLSLLILTYPINYPLFVRLRPADIVLILFAAWGLFHTGIKLSCLTALICMFYIFYFMSTLYGVLFVGIVSPNNFIYFYKYSLLFAVLWLVLSSKLSEQQIRKLLKLLFFSFLLVVGYALATVCAAKYMYPQIAHKFRPNFPFTNPFSEEHGGYLGDSHLLAAYISSGFLAVVLCRHYNLLKTSRVFYYPLLVTIFVALLLTGSRNGVITLTSTLILFSTYLFLSRLSYARPITHVRKATVRLAVGVIGALCVILLCYQKYGKGSFFGATLLSRTLSVHFLQDKSALGRIRKLGVAADLVLDGPVLIGVGMQSSPLAFFDGAIPSILVSSGFGGVLTFTMIILVFFAEVSKKAAQNRTRSEFVILFFVSLNYILANLITEFFLISRSIIPFALFLGLMVRLIQMPRSSLIIEGNQDEGFNNYCLPE